MLWMTYITIMRSAVYSSSRLLVPDIIPLTRAIKASSITRSCQRWLMITVLFGRSHHHHSWSVISIFSNIRAPASVVHWRVATGCQTLLIHDVTPRYHVLNAKHARTTVTFIAASMLSSDDSDAEKEHKRHHALSPLTTKQHRHRILSHNKRTRRGGKQTPKLNSRPSSPWNTSKKVPPKTPSYHYGAEPNRRCPDSSRGSSSSDF